MVPEGFTNFNFIGEEVPGTPAIEKSPVYLTIPFGIWTSATIIF